MKKNLNLILISIVLINCCLSFSSSAMANGELFGYVKDSASLEPVQYAAVVVKNGETIIGGANADNNGMYKISAIPPGTYTVEASYVNYGTVRITGVLIAAEQTLRLDFAISLNQNDVIIVTEYIHKLINPQEISSISYIDLKDFEDAPVMDIKDRIAAVTPGTYQRDVGQPINVRGSREDATAYIVDGMRMIGKFSVPNCAVEQISVITGGIPAQYGDATGGVVIITTKSYFSRR